jgi:hypothetical protein
LEKLNKKYCEWAASGKCYKCDPSVCEQYGIECNDLHLTSRTEYILDNLNGETEHGQFHPGILTLFGSFDAKDQPVPWTKVNVDIYEEGSQIHINPRGLWRVMMGMHFIDGSGSGMNRIHSGLWFSPQIQDLKALLQ